jgi:hypothetical protein
MTLNRQGPPSGQGTLWHQAVDVSTGRAPNTSLTGYPHAGARYRGPWRLPGPDSHRLAAVSLPLGYVVVLLLSVVLSARATGRTFPRNQPRQGPTRLNHAVQGCLGRNGPPQVSSRRLRPPGARLWHLDRGRGRDHGCATGAGGIAGPRWCLRLGLDASTIPSVSNWPALPATALAAAGTITATRVGVGSRTEP